MQAARGDVCCNQHAKPLSDEHSYPNINRANTHKNDNTPLNLDAVKDLYTLSIIYPNSFSNDHPDADGYTNCHTYLYQHSNSYVYPSALHNDIIPDSHTIHHPFVDNYTDKVSRSYADSCYPNRQQLV